MGKALVKIGLGGCCQLVTEGGYPFHVFVFEKIFIEFLLAVLKKIAQELHLHCNVLLKILELG